MHFAAFIATTILIVTLTIVALYLSRRKPSPVAVTTPPITPQLKHFFDELGPELNETKKNILRQWLDGRPEVVAILNTLLDPQLPNPDFFKALTEMTKLCGGYTSESAIYAINLQLPCRARLTIEGPVPKDLITAGFLKNSIASDDNSLHFSGGW